MTTAEKLTALLLRNALGLFGTAISSRLSILIFHRVRAVPDPLFPCEPDARRFESLMRFVAATFRVMTLGEAIDHLARGTLPPRSLVITFDDGYADNAEVALPILQRLGLRATFFISTGFLDGGRMWNDSVIECLRACRLTTVDLEEFGLGRCELADLSQRRQVIVRLLSCLKYRRLPEREAAVGLLRQLCGVELLPHDLMMRSEQVAMLHRSGMEIGAHTVHHPILTTLMQEEAETEIDGGREQLQSIIDAPVDVFAYPNGKPGVDYDESHVALVERLGFRGAVSTAPGAAQAGDDPFQLPRFTPWGKSLPVWAARLLMNQWNTSFSRAWLGAK
ncbi:polysaccharide deacetylase family protein [Propionivibrio limicola]|uniref:polysaccharide deacetylase family protein n=1 Tax=Propionivibrio limicola TaxID=167645 RepID=UPI00129265A7|nr:polysaccharide deacetylase family protein [Propionivibrio limicola]